jgi:hypothetical protein
LATGSFGSSGVKSAARADSVMSPKAGIMAPARRPPLTIARRENFLSIGLILSVKKELRYFVVSAVILACLDTEMF